MKKLIKPFPILLSVLLFSCSSGQENNTDNENNKKAFLQNIKTYKATWEFPKEEWNLSGKVDYDPDKVVNYTPLISGVAEKTYFSLGDKVRKGQALLDIRSTELSNLHSEYVTLENELKIAERELQTTQSLFDDNMVSEKELLEAKNNLLQIQSKEKRIKSDMAVYGENKGNGVFSVKSPMLGYIVDKNVSSGSPVSMEGEPLFTVADLSSVWITANVYAGNVSYVKEGMEVEIKTLSYPDEIFKGKIDALSQVFDPEEKVLKARIRMPNKDLRFKPEMAVVVTLKNEENQSLISIPSDALIFDKNKYHVVVKENEETFKIKEVTLQGHHQETTYLASGLSEGEEVVIRNQLLIYTELNEF